MSVEADAIARSPDFDGPAARRSETARHVALVRDIVGNPFRPAAFDPAWRTATALSLASQMYESRDFGAMPILADALQDAGCDNDDILSHCRGPGPHVRGCWVVDLVLCKGVKSVEFPYPHYDAEFGCKVDGCAGY